LDGPHREPESCAGKRVSFRVSRTIYHPSHVEFLVITFVGNFIIWVSENAGAAELDVTYVLDVVYNLWLKISYKVLSNGYISGFRRRGVR